MVTTDVSQLTAECSTWRQKLREYRDEFTLLKNQLRQMVLSVTQKSLLRDVDHYENQFHIQLINIHDLKHSIKTHEHKTNLERSYGKGHISDFSLSFHDRLNEDYQRLVERLNMLKDEFREFIGKAK